MPIRDGIWPDAGMGGVEPHGQDSFAYNIDKKNAGLGFIEWRRKQAV